MNTPPAPRVAAYLAYWLNDAVRPRCQPCTYAYYESMVRLYVVPALGARRLDTLETAEVESWLRRLAVTCQCCAQGKDARRPPGKRRCCAIGACCGARPAKRTVEAARSTLRAALNHARAADQLVTRNVAAYAALPQLPGRDPAEPAWNPEHAARLVMSAWKDSDPLCAAYALALLSDLPRGRILGLIWPNVSVDRDELDPSWQLQRVCGKLIHRLAPAAGAAQVSLPQFCRAALKRRREDQAAAREQAGARWRDSQFVFTTRWGSPIEPRNLNRSFATRCARAGVPRISMRDARRACAPLSEDLLQDTDSDS